jgi:hypothetical protein
MAFSPIDLPIQEILLTNFVTDIATISNANSLILKDKIEDIVNQLEIDTVSLSIGTDNPINYVRASSFIVQDTGITFQTGTPTQVIAKLEKNASVESVFTVDNINVNLIADIETATVNSLTINNDVTIDGPAVMTSTFECTNAMIDSKETVTLPLTLAISGTEAEATLTLTSASRRHIFVRFDAVTAPSLNYVYDGAGGFGSITDFILYLDFDATNPPAQNTTFTIHLVDIREDVTFTSILTEVNNFYINTKIQAGVNQSVTPTPTAIILHNGGTSNLGINLNSVNAASQVLLSNAHSYYGHSLTVTYILDENTDDRLIVNSMVGLEFF